jgi:hypothetical protein
MTLSAASAIFFGETMAKQKDPIEAAKVSAADEASRPISAVLGTPSADLPPIPAVEEAPPAPPIPQVPGTFPAEAKPSVKWRVVAKSSARLRGQRISLAAGKIIDENAYGSEIFAVLTEQGVALERVVD